MFSEVVNVGVCGVDFIICIWLMMNSVVWVMF